MDRVQVVASLFDFNQPVSTSNPIELLVFNAEQLASLDSIDEAEDGSIELATILAQETPEIWRLSAAQLTAGTALALVGCAGDFDGDEHEDIMIALTHLNDLLQVRRQVILFAYSDLNTIDRLDGEEDKQVNVDLLWPND